MFADKLKTSIWSGSYTSGARVCHLARFDLHPTGHVPVCSRWIGESEFDDAVLGKHIRGFWWKRK